jgi:hypothetical protein
MLLQDAIWESWDAMGRLGRPDKWDERCFDLNVCRMDGSPYCSIFFITDLHGGLGFPLDLYQQNTRRHLGYQTNESRDRA